MKVLIGNLLESKMQTLVNTVNCVGVMGKGIALLFKESYPAMFQDYKARCNAGYVRPGEPYLYVDLFGTSILNFPTKDHWRSPSRMSYVENGLAWFQDNYRRLGIESVAFPPLGCGNGGLDWRDVGPLMYEKLAALPIEIEIYAPYGTPPEQLSQAFLSSSSEYAFVPIGRKCRGYNRKWDLVLQAIRLINEDRYSTDVGRTVYQKICYVFQRVGIDMGFVFAKGDYGPFSKEANEALRIMANDNLITEETLGDMVLIDAGEHFTFDSNQFTASELTALSDVVDLFCRVRNTAQAERVATLLYSYDVLVAEGRNECNEVSEEDVLKFVISWKPHWNSSSAIRDLQQDLYSLNMLDWIEMAELSFDEQE